MIEPVYKRILLKVSGESLAGEKEFGISGEAVKQIVGEIAKVHELGVEIGIVIGGGNMFRGTSPEFHFIDRPSADQMGMLATVINSLAMQNSLEKHGIFTRVLTAIDMEEIAEPFIRRRAVRHLEKKRIVIFAAGTGSPFFTTDTAAALRAVEIGADVVLKGTRVEGVYTSDPEIHADAKKYDTLTYMEFMKRELEVIDSTAVTLCKDNNIPIVIFNILTPDNSKRVVLGESIGTRIEANQ